MAKGIQADVIWVAGNPLLFRSMVADTGRAAVLTSGVTVTQPPLGLET